MRKNFIFLLIIAWLTAGLAIACGDGADTPAGEPGQPAASGSDSDEAGAESAASHDQPIMQLDAIPAPYIILSMQSGDIACYVKFKDANGTVHDWKAEFELCDDSLAGKRVAMTSEMANLPSPECEGDPECTKSIEEEIIATIARL